MVKLRSAGLYKWPLAACACYLLYIAQINVRTRADVIKARNRNRINFVVQEYFEFLVKNIM